MNRSYSFANGDGTTCRPLLRMVHAATLTGVALGGASCGGGQSFDDGSDELGTNSDAPTTMVIDDGGPDGTPGEVSVQEPTEVVIDAGSREGAPSEDSLDEPSDVSAIPQAERSYLLTVPDISWVEPRGVGDDIGSFVPTFAITWTDSGVWLGTADENGRQEPCAPALVAGADPIAIGPIDLPVYLRNGDVEVAATLYDFTLTNVVSQQGPAEDGTLHVVLDAREIAPLFTLLVERTAKTVCAAARDGLMVDCQPCTTDGQPYCLEATADSLGAAEQPSALALTAERTGDACPGASAP